MQIVAPLMTVDPHTPEYSRFSRLKFTPFPGFRRWLQYGLVRFFLVFATRLPIRISQRLGRWTALLLIPFLPREWAICMYQLEMVYPDMPPLPTFSRPANGVA